MKTFLLTILMLTSLYAIAQYPQIPENRIGNRTGKPITRIESRNDGININHLDMLYDSRNNLIHRMFSQANVDSSNIWGTISKTEFEYDNKDSLRYQTEYSFKKNDWYFSTRDHYEWDDRGNMLLYANMYFDKAKNIWYDAYVNIRKFDQLNNEIYFLYAKMIDDTLRPRQLYINEYNDKNKIIRRVDGMFATNYEYYKYIYFLYDENLNLKQINVYGDTTASPWSVSNYVYNSKGKKIKSTNYITNSEGVVNTLEENFVWDSTGYQTLYSKTIRENDQFINQSTVKTEYDDKHNITMQSSESIDDSSMAVKKQRRYIMTYDQNSNMLTKLIERDSSENWYPRERYTYTYNEFNQELTMLFEIFIDGEWVKYQRIIHEYDSIGDLLHIGSESWNSSDGWYLSPSSNSFSAGKQSYSISAYDMKIEYEYSTAEEQPEEIDIIVSPNPASDYIEISGCSIILSEAKDPVIRIYDLLGVEVLYNSQLSILNSQLKIDVSHLAPGVYFVRVGDFVRKFVKM